MLRTFYKILLISRSDKSHSLDLQERATLINSTVDGKKDVVTRVGYERREVTKKRPDGTEYTATRSVRIAKKTGKEI